jgi:hypothetical protein
MSRERMITGVRMGLGIVSKRNLPLEFLDFRKLLNRHARESGHPVRLRWTPAPELVEGRGGDDFL